ncbi:MAG: hypothetical protein GKR88_12995 [Flavobacteriaceae bacterium]|nr:MAG: hypothetical protein GKR88_12995 [Flavobacteriaceae bacterium]
MSYSDYDIYELLELYDEKKYHLSKLKEHNSEEETKIKEASKKVENERSKEERHCKILNLAIKFLREEITNTETAIKSIEPFNQIVSKKDKEIENLKQQIKAFSTELEQEFLKLHSLENEKKE